MSRRTVMLGVAAALALAAGAASGREFDVKPLTATDVRCRAPSVSETGLAAWVQYTGLEGETEAVRADLWVCAPGGEPQNLTGDEARFSGRIEQPVASGDGVCFLGWFAEDAEQGPEFALAAPDLTDEMKAMEDEYPSLFDGAIAMKSPVAKAEGEGEEGGEGEGESPKAEGEGEGEGDEGQMRRNPAAQSGGSVAYWRDGRFERLTPGGFAFYAPVAGDGAAAFLCARRWPYGYDLVGWSQERGLVQLTTNYFYVQHPRMQGKRVVWQEWDGNDYEIFMHDFESGETQQLTNNTFDDVEPEVWGDQVVWVAFPLTTGEIFLWKEGEIKKINDATTENASPSIWEGRVVWQGMGDDGKQTEIYYFDGKRTIKLTSNIWDDRDPVIRDNIVAWISHVDLGDSEVMALDLRDNIPVQLTNDGEEDSCVGVGGERVVWQTDVGTASYLRMAEAKPLELPQTED
jgi:beta propeller repeat protein